MLYFITLNTSLPNHSVTHSLHRHVSKQYAPLLAILLCASTSSVAEAQRALPSHGKLRLDSYNHLLADVHPASQAQANYEQNCLFLTGLKKAERLERQERLDAYGEKQSIKTLKNYDSVVKRISVGCAATEDSLASFWALVSAFGDREEVYEALSIDVPPIANEQFVSTRRYIRIVLPNGELEEPPLVLVGVDATKFQHAWSTVAENLRLHSPTSGRVVAEFRDSVAAYREQGALAIAKISPLQGRVQAEVYLRSLGSLADALCRPRQCAQIQAYIVQGGYDYRGGSVLGLVQHLLHNGVTPARGSTAQIALAELARPIGRVLEHEIALHVERIDSLAAEEGNRPYAPEYRGQVDPRIAVSNLGISSRTP